jgi:transglutaminase-like putative cysteine protease
VRNPAVLRFPVLRSTIVLFLLLSPMLVRAQFQNPTPEELKMTDDPRNPGAAAVYLNVAEIADNSLHYESTYARIKILSEKALDLATIELPYVHEGEYQYKVTAIQGRTIHPDGTIVPLTGKPDDLLVAKQGDTRFGRKVFNLPSVQVGSIIEYYYQLRYSDDWYFPPTWHVQRSYPVRKAHYLFTPYDPRGANSVSDRASLSVWTVLPEGAAVKTDAVGRYSLDMTDIPPAPNEDWMPPIESSLYRVEFYFQDSSNVDAFWQAIGNRWSKTVDQFAEQSNSVHGAVNGLVAPTDAPIDKARKLYAAVLALDNTDFTREKSKAERKQLNLKNVKHADDVWTQKSGNSTEIALLYLAMLRAAGLNAYAMRVVDRNRSVFAPGYMYFDQLDDTIVLLNIDGKEIVLDPGEKMCPFQTVSWRHSIATGLRQTSTGSAIWTTPRQPYTANTIQRTGEVTLDAHGAVDGNLRILMTGQEALYWRQKALENDDAEVKKQFDVWIADMVPDGVDAHVDHFIGLDNEDTKLAAVITAKGTAGSATSKRLLIPALFFASHGSHPFVDQAKRLTPVDMHYGDTISDDVTYNLPTGVEVESAPQPTKVPWEGHAVLIVKSGSGHNAVTVTRTLARSFTLASNDEYPTLRDFYQKVAAADQQQIVLDLTPAAKGN